MFLFHLKKFKWVDPALRIKVVKFTKIDTFPSNFFFIQKMCKVTPWAGVTLHIGFKTLYFHCNDFFLCGASLHITFKTLYLRCNDLYGASLHILSLKKYSDDGAVLSE